MDEAIEEIYMALLKHERMLVSASSGQLQLSGLEVDLIRRRITRCEGWLRVMGKHVLLADIRARVNAYKNAAAAKDAPRPPQATRPARTASSSAGYPVAPRYG